MKNNTAYIAFGSNKGDCLKNIRTALKELAKYGAVKQISPLFRTKPEGFAAQADFINGALALETALPPQDLLAKLKEIETSVGREKTFRNGPREIDLDIIFYGNKTLNLPTLQIPHPRFAQREFVLLPLSFIARERIDPISKKTVGELLEVLKHAKGQSDCIKLDEAV